MKQGFAHLVLLVVLLLAAGAAVIYFLSSRGVVQLPGAKPTVTLQQSYKNPFNKDSQYVNPFDTSKSP